MYSRTKSVEIFSGTRILCHVISLSAIARPIFVTAMAKDCANLICPVLMKLGGDDMILLRA